MDGAAEDFDERVVLAVETADGREVWTGVWSASGTPTVDPPRDWTPDRKGLVGPVALALRWAEADVALTPGMVERMVRAVVQRSTALDWEVTGLQLDADIPTARLAQWAGVVADVAEHSPVPISVLALVDHVDKPGWTTLSASAARVIVQVHSVPLSGPDGPVLFDGTVASDAVERAARTTAGPLAVALPTHTLFEVETGRPVRAEPAALVSWLAKLEARSPARLTGVMWFRLPVEGDETTWTGAALAQVRAGEIPLGGVELRVDQPPSEWQADGRVRALWLDSSGVDHGRWPSVRVCGASERRVVAGMDGRVIVAEQTDGCVVVRPRVPYLLAPGESVAAALILADDPAALRVSRLEDAERPGNH